MGYKSKYFQNKYGNQNTSEQTEVTQNQTQYKSKYFQNKYGGGQTAPSGRLDIPRNVDFKELTTMRNLSRTGKKEWDDALDAAQFRERNVNSIGSDLLKAQQNTKTYSEQVKALETKLKGLTGKDGYDAAYKEYEEAWGNLRAAAEKQNMLYNQYSQMYVNYSKAIDAYNALVEDERKYVGRLQQLQERVQNAQEQKNLPATERMTPARAQRKEAVSYERFHNDRSLSDLYAMYNGDYGAYLNGSLGASDEVKQLKQEWDAFVASDAANDPDAIVKWQERLEQVNFDRAAVPSSDESRRYSAIDPQGLDPVSGRTAKNAELLKYMRDDAASRVEQAKVAQWDAQVREEILASGGEELMSLLLEMEDARRKMDNLTMPGQPVDAAAYNEYNAIRKQVEQAAGDRMYDWEQYAERMRSNQLMAAREASIAATTGKNGWAAAGMNLAAVPFSLASGVGMLDVGMQKLERAVMGSDAPLDYNSDMQIPGKFSSTVRDTTASMIEEKTRGKAGSDTAFGNLYTGAYQLGTSMLDSAAVVGMTMIGIPGGTWLLGGSAGNQAMLNAKERGASDMQALGVGAISAVAEALFEKVGIDKLTENIKDATKLRHILRSAAKQAIPEATEEGLTNITNLIADRLIMGGLSEYETSIRKYMAQGMSRADAAAQANKDTAIALATDVIGGAISGGIFGLGGGALNVAINRRNNAQTEQQITTEVMPEAAKQAEIVQTTQAQTPNALMEAAMEMHSEAPATTEVQRANEAASKVFGETGKRAFATLNDGTVNPEQLYKGFAVMYNAGQMGKAAADVKQESVRALSELQSRIAYEAGQKDADTSLNTREATVGTGVVAKKDAGLVINEHSKKLYRTEFRKIDVAAKAIGRKVIMEDIGVDNGYVDQDGVIHMDIRTEDPLSYILAHEVTHVLEDQAPVEHKAFRDFAVSKMAQILDTSVQELIADKRAEYEGRQQLTDEQAMNELAANFTREMMKRRDLFEEFAKQNTTAAQRFLDTVVEIFQRIKNALTGDKTAFEKEVQRKLGADVASVEEAIRLWTAALDRAVSVASETQKAGNENTAQQDGGQKRHSTKGTEFTEDKYFARQMDKWDELADGIRVKVGTVREGSALNRVGLPAAGMYFDVGKIRTAMGKHADHLLSGILKGIPDLLNDPIVITEYRGPKGDIDNTVSVYGNLFLPNSATPVVVGIVMRRDINGQTLINNIRTVHARSDFAKQITDKSVLYLNEDRKKTRTWFHVCGILNVPLNGTKYGLIRSISFSDHSVKTDDTTLDGEVATSQSGAPVAVVNKDGSSRLSIKTYEEGGRSFYENYLNRRVKEGKLSAEDASDMISKLDEIYGVCKTYKNKYAPFSAWSDAKVVVDDQGNPVFSVIKKNGEYVMNLDFSLVCKKRRTLDAVFNAMVKNGMIDKLALGEADIVRINDIIRSHDLETACALCFVDAKRFRQANVALQFADIYNGMVKSMIPEGSKTKAAYHNFGGNAYLPDIQNGIDTMSDDELDMRHIDEVLQSAPAKKANWTVEHKVAEYLKQHPEDRKMVDVGDFMSTAGFEQAQKTKPGIMGLYNAKKGSGGPKAAFGDVQYLNDILKRARTFNVKKAYSIGGVRVQSFSDYVARMVFDYVQMISELSALGLPAHAYTKETMFAMQFGKTGMKINLSLIPAVVDGGIAPGLDADGNYVWADESFPYEDAIRIQNADGYSQNCGTICVGVSDEHIRMLMADDNIRMVIPYHKSGLNHIVASMNKIDQFEDYTNVQNTRYADSGTKLSKEDAKKEIGFNQRLRSMGKNADPRKAAEGYVRWCEDKGYLPKFDQFAYKEIDGEPVFDDQGRKAVDENYYKLLTDFAVYDNGAYTAQGPVKMVFPEEGDAFGSLAQLIEQGLEEDAILEAKRTMEVPKIVDEIAEAFDVDHLRRSQKGKSTVDEAFDRMGELIEKYGEIPAGENPYREAHVARKTSKKKIVSQTVRTILEAEVTPDEALPTIEEMVLDDKFSYERFSDKRAIEEADAVIRDKGYATALAEWIKQVEKGVVSKSNTALGWALYNQAATAKDLKTAMTILTHMVEHQRSAAQAVQATRILKQLSPDAQLYGIQRSVANLQRELVKKYGDKAVDLKVNEEYAEEFLSATTDRGRTEAMQKIYKDIGKQVPSTFIDKWNAWRYLAMLGNVRTHVRNIAGNALFAPVVAAKNVLATSMEGILMRKSDNRTKAFVGMSKADRDLVQAAKDDYKNVADQIMGAGKYNDGGFANQYIQEGRQVFRFKPLEAARKGNSAALEKEDMWFSRPHYTNALAQYCKAHKITAEQIRSGKALDLARSYAIKEAQKATYRDLNAFSDLFSRRFSTEGNFGRVGKAANTVMEGVLPFRKTPANILARGVEYSPLGLLMGITVDLVQVKKGNMTGAEAIDHISAGMVGTALMGLGFILASSDLVRGVGDEDENKREFEDLMGHQAYSLELPSGDSYTLDWLAPEALPFFVGVNLYEGTLKENDEMKMSDVMGVISNITAPMLEMSCLQGLNDMIDSVGYASQNDGSALFGILTAAVTSYLTQAIPTLMGQGERTSEDVRMTTYTDKNKWLTTDAQYTIGKASAKIPGWDYGQIPYIDAWGTVEKTGEAWQRAFNNFINPSYYSQIDTSEMEEELIRLYDQVGESYIFPSRAAKYFMMKGDRIDLTAEQYVTYATEKGRTSFKVASDIVSDAEYDELTDDDKAKAVRYAYEYANAIAKTKVSEYQPDGWVAKAMETCKNTNLSVARYIFAYMSQVDVESLKDVKGDPIDNSASLQKMEAIYNIEGLTSAQYKALFADCKIGKSVINMTRSQVAAELAKMRRKAKK